MAAWFSRFGLHQLVQDLLGEQVLALVVQFPAASEDLLGAAHHLHVERRGVARRQRNEGRRVAVPEPEEALDDAAAVVLRRAVIAAAVPLVLQALRHLVDVVDLVDGHALVGEVQHLVVHVGVEIALAAEHFLNPLVAPARPVVRGEHDLGLQAETVERLADVLRPVQRIAHRSAAQRVDVVQRRDDVLGHPERLHLGDVGVHLPGRFGVRRVLEDHLNAIDLDFLDVLLDVAGSAQSAPRRRPTRPDRGPDRHNHADWRAAGGRTGRTAAGSWRCRRRRFRRSCAP